MTTGGWVLLVISLSFVWGLLIWCYSRILSGHDHLGKGPDLL